MSRRDPDYAPAKRMASTDALAGELALVGIAAVWGLTFVMVQDAIALLPTMVLAQGPRGVDDRSGAALVYYCLAAVDVADRRPIAPQGTVDAAYCLGRLIGVLDLHAMAVTHLGLPPQYCMPASASVEDAMRVVVGYLRRHHTMLHETGVALTLAALTEMWPCRP